MAGIGLRVSLLCRSCFFFFSPTSIAQSLRCSSHHRRECRKENKTQNELLLAGRSELCEDL